MVKEVEGHLPVTDSPTFDVVVHHVQLCERISYLTEDLSKEIRKHWLSANIFFTGR